MELVQKLQPQRGLGMMYEILVDLEDPRIDRSRKHLLSDVVIMALFSVVAGCRGWEEIERFSVGHADLFETFLKLPEGIPSHDTFRRVFSALDPQGLQRVTLRFLKCLKDVSGDRQIAIDGKSLRHSFDRAIEQGPLHLLQAWSTDQGVVLGQVPVGQKTNEITKMSELLELIDIKGAVVTADAMHCQTETAKEIVSKGGDYTFTVKGNHPELYERLQARFEQWTKDPSDIPLLFEEMVEKDHGRLETRKYYQVKIDRWTHSKKEWVGLQTVGMVESHREIQGKITIERRYFISSLPLDIKRFMESVRNHWSIENQLHYHLDVLFREDDSRIRRDRAAENFAILRRVALSLLKMAPPLEKRDTLRARQFMAQIKREYLLSVFVH